MMMPAGADNKDGSGPKGKAGKKMSLSQRLNAKAEREENQGISFYKDRVANEVHRAKARQL